MPDKITSKNLSYTSSLPPFLARLHAQSAGVTGPDPLLAAQKRSTKKRSSSEEAEDAPLVVDERGNAVSLRLDKDGTVRGETRSDEDEARVAQLDDKAEKWDADAPVSVGGRKRKAGRVVGEGANHGLDKDGQREQRGELGNVETTADKKVKKKAKKIKLSFDEDQS
ncbi:uncharacterized protein MAM_00231 [Metarhizium album ARSEF 1941]|uniref:DUF4604 domain-containing protein n=1 Tax=Metarhizium album (strain ARSEF 1941) TaxID=1081103 RepID=A0A0B2X6Y1_METAS|nr:uncharacterized protein MAM_00231 [Metarhizium album ARSEF 1941]KHO01230.1 hypothetical protein MAM_00231 [Metarhizium album ARSEF 1941]